MRPTMRLQVGDEAPDFTLPDVDGKPVNITGYRKGRNLVIAFVPAAFTPVWSVQLPAYNADLEKFAGFDAAVVAVSTDNTHSNKAWVEKMGGLNYPVLSDFWPHGNASIRYGVLREEGISERAIFLIDKQGKIAYLDIHDISDQPDNEDLFEVLRKM